jgi:hypothetical protein
MSWLLIISVSSMPIAKAAPSCPEVLDACNAVNEGMKRQLDLTTIGLNLREDEMKRIGEENAQLRKRGTGLFDNPLVWAAIGVIAGAYAGARATR